MLCFQRGCATIVIYNNLLQVHEHITEKYIKTYLSLIFYFLVPNTINRTSVVWLPPTQTHNRDQWLHLNAHHTSVSCIPGWLFVCPWTSKSICLLAGCGFLRSHGGNELLALCWECCDGLDAEPKPLWSSVEKNLSVRGWLRLLGVSVYTTSSQVSLKKITQGFLLSIRHWKVQPVK